MVGTRFYGRMGNVLFQAATCIAYALKNDLPFSFPNRTQDPKWNPLYLQHLVDPRYVQGREDILINEPCYEYRPIEFKEEWRGRQVVLNGYWQSERYFKEYRTMILDLFGYPYEIKPDVCSIHARFGDYLTIKGKHILIDETYLNNAIEIVKSKTGITRYKVFSDDLNYFRSKFANVYDFEYSDNGSEVADMIEISCCHSNINSSSTFSWWGAWMNKNPEKVIVCQKDWFQPGWMNMDTRDVLPETWIKL